MDKGIIVKVSNLSRVTNRLVGYFRATEHDFDRKVVPDKGLINNKPIFDLVPNSFFYKKFKRQLKVKWQENFGYMLLNETQTYEQLDNYAKKIEFYQKQENALKTLINL